MKRLLCALLALSLLAAPALAQGYKLDFIDEQGVYLEALTTQWKEDKLGVDVVVENDTGRAIDLRIEDAYADGSEIAGVGIGAAGAEDVGVRLSLMRAARALLDVELDQIEVIQMRRDARARTVVLDGLYLCASRGGGGPALRATARPA